ncbi:MAG: hypothetical protein K0R57_4199 [Paenibacillaceae bacterium]|nr:hypothetical protein [Paenibacillaceae bacterium]
MLSVLLLGLGLLGIAGGSIAYGADGDRAAKVTDLSGEVMVYKGGGEQSYSAFTGMLLSEGDSISTGSSSWVELELDDDKLVKLTENTQMSIDELTGSEEAGDDSTGLKLWFGNMWNNVKKKLGGDAEYEVRTPKTVMGVRGTQFYVSLHDRNTVIAVLEGRILAVTTTMEQLPDSSVLERVIQTYIEPNQQAVIQHGASTDADIQVKPVELERIDPSILVEILQSSQGLDKETTAKVTGILERTIAQVPPYVLVDLLRATDNLPGSLRDRANESLQERKGEIDIRTLQNIIGNPQGISEETVRQLQGEEKVRSSAGQADPAPNRDRVIIADPKPNSGGNNNTSGGGSGSGGSSEGSEGGSDDGSGIIHVTGVAVSPQTWMLSPGDSKQLEAMVSPAHASNRQVAWSSGNPAVAVVHSSGLVEAIAPGTTAVTVATADGGYRAVCQITVAYPLADHEYISAYEFDGEVSVSGTLAASGRVVIRVWEGTTELAGQTNEVYPSGSEVDFFYQASVHSDRSLTYAVEVYDTLSAAPVRVISGPVVRMSEAALESEGDALWIRGKINAPDQRMKLSLESEDTTGRRIVAYPSPDGWSSNWTDVSSGQLDVRIPISAQTIADGSYEVVFSFDQVNSSAYFGVVAGRITVAGGRIVAVEGNSW